MYFHCIKFETLNDVNLMISFLEYTSSAFSAEFPWNWPQSHTSLNTFFLASIFIIQSFSEPTSESD